MKLSLRAALALLLTAFAQPSSAQTQTGVLGTNLNSLSDFNRQWAFVDAFKLSRPWLDASFNDFPAGQIDADGWVTSLGGAAPTNQAQALMFFDGSGHYPATPNCVGTPSAANCYVLKFDGAGTITFGAGASIVSTPGPGNRFFVNVPQQTPGNGGIILRLTATTPGNPVKNIRFIMAGFEATADAQPFHPTFLQTLAPYKLIRFMDWMGTNGSTIQNFSQWKTLASATQTVVDPGFNEHGSGVAFEYMVDLCNTLDADMWITLPAQATDAFMTSAATLIRDRLEPGRKLYIEYSNEIWNGQFLQGAFVQSQGEFFGLGAGFTARLNYQARRSKEIFALFETAFGGTSRLVRVLAGQAANADLVRQVALFENSFLKADVIALAPYMDGGGRVGNLANLTTLNNAQVISQMQTDLVGTSDNDNHVKLWLDTHRSLVHGPGLFGSFTDGMVNDQGTPLRIVAYEGGQHLLALGPNNGNATANTLLDNVNRDALMGTLYKQYFCQWRATTGSDTFTHFNDIFGYGQFGRWGALEFQDQVTSTSPKFLALEDYSIGGIDCAGLGFPNPPLISVDDVSVSEGNAGPTNLTFTVSLSAPAPSAITVKAKTFAGSATAGSDFTTLTQTVSFGMGEMSKPVTVVVNGDGTVEGQETVFVNLSNPTGAPIADAHGVGTIINDDGLGTPPTVTTDAATAVTQTGATLNGTINPNGTATNRRFQSGLTTGYGNTSADLAIGSGNVGVGVSFAVSGLLCNTTYHYRAVGQNAGGTTNGGDLTFTTTACPPVGSGNISAATARAVAVNSTTRDSISNVRAEVWYRVRLFADRSYQLSAWPADHEQGVDAATLALNLFSNDGGTTPATPAPTVSSGALEGSANNGDTLPTAVLFQPSTTGVYKIRILRSSGGTVAHSINVAVRETTLFSPWTSRGAGFEGFIELHNNTNAVLSVTLRGYDSAGTLQGTGLTFNIPADATVFKTATEAGVASGIFAGIALTHNGAFGAVSGNITTLNGANGLSFDSPFTARDGGLQARPVR